MALMTPPNQQTLNQTYQDPRGFMQMPTTMAALRPQPAITELLNIQPGESSGADKKDGGGAGGGSRSQIGSSPLSKSDKDAEHSGYRDNVASMTGSGYTSAQVPDGWSEAMTAAGLMTGAPFGGFARAVEWAFGDTPWGTVGEPSFGPSTPEELAANRMTAAGNRVESQRMAEKDNTATSGGVTRSSGGSGGFTDDRTHGTNQDATQNSSPQPSAADREASRNSGGGEGAGGGSSGSDTGGTSGGRGDTAGTSEPGGMGGY